MVLIRFMDHRSFFMKSFSLQSKQKRVTIFIKGKLISDSSVMFAVVAKKALRFLPFSAESCH
jgi:hypothetical protein